MKCGVGLEALYVVPPYYRAKMYDDCVACCPMVSHGECVDGTDRQMDERTPHERWQCVIFCDPWPMWPNRPQTGDP